MVSCISCKISQTTRNQGVTFHRFPKNPARRCLWLNFVNKDGTDLPKNCFLCSEHFEEVDFHRTSKSKVQLRKNAVPTKVVLRSKYVKGKVYQHQSDLDTQTLQPASYHCATTDHYVSHDVIPTVQARYGEVSKVSHDVISTVQAKYDEVSKASCGEAMPTTPAMPGEVFEVYSGAIAGSIYHMEKVQHYSQYGGRQICRFPRFNVSILRPLPLQVGSATPNKESSVHNHSVAPATSETFTKWILALPLNLYLKQSECPSSGSGVWALEDISIGVRFGPFQETFDNNNKNKKEGFQLQVEAIEKENSILDRRKESDSSWFSYVNHAHHKEESNMIIFHTEAGVYYISSRLIPANTELLVYNQYNNIEDGEGYNKKEVGSKLAPGIRSLIDHAYNSNCVKHAPQLTALNNKVGTMIPLPSNSAYSISAEKSKLICSDYEPVVSNEGTFIHINNVTGSKNDFNENCRTDAFIERNKVTTCEETSENMCGLNANNKLFESKANPVCEDRIELEERRNNQACLECNVCGRKFNHRECLRMHRITHTGEKPFACKACGKKFNQEYKLRTHEKMHSEEKAFKCNTCGKMFTCRKYLVVHENIHLGKKPYACNRCRKGFTRRSNLIMHERTHTGEKPFVCNTCGKKFIGRSSLILHERIHTGEKPFECNQCGKKFAGRRYLAMHERIHTSEKPFLCYTCGKRFICRSYLTLHERRIHARDKAFSCNTCEKRFISNDHLILHEMRHAGETRHAFQCHKCGKILTNKSNLIMHEQLHTEKKPFFLCHICGKRLSTKSYLIAHEKFHTGEKLFPCSMCGSKFISKCNLIKHERTHSGIKRFECKTCGKKFNSKTRFTMHKRIHTGKNPFGCNLCGKKFTDKYIMKRHETIHSGKKPFECNTCGEKFTRIRHLIMHERIHACEKLFSCNTHEKKLT